MERKSRHQETQAKKALTLVSPLFVTSQSFKDQGSGYPPRVSKNPIVDWPCQDFTQGSTKEQPNAEPLVKTFLKICIQDRRDQQWEDEVASEG